MTAKVEKPSPALVSHTRIWDALGKTDPAITKSFSRAGGFKGTAIKPIWIAHRMTEYFGPCGLGWGMDKPEYQPPIFAKDEGLVFCTVGLWYIDPETKERGQVYGVGGDKFLLSQSSGQRTSDEAFKAAYTDALSNAMKQLGVGADVHMGLFEDAKYVNDVRSEFDKPELKAPEYLVPTAKAIAAAIKAATATEELDALKEKHKDDLAQIAQFFPGTSGQLANRFGDRYQQLNNPEN